MLFQSTPKVGTLNLKLSRLGDGNLGPSLSRLRSVRLNILDNVKTLNNGPKHNVLSIEPLSLCGADKELGAVRVGPSIGHGENPWPGMLESKVLISKLLPVNRLATGSIVTGKVTALTHELGNDAVENGAFETEALFSSAKSAEVFGCFFLCVCAVSFKEMCDQWCVFSYQSWEPPVAYTPQVRYKV